VSQFSIFSFAPWEDFTLSRQREAMFAAGVDGKFLDENVLDGLKEWWRSERVCAADTKSTAGAVASRIHLATVIQHCHSVPINPHCVRTATWHQWQLAVWMCWEPTIAVHTPTRQIKGSTHSQCSSIHGQLTPILCSNSTISHRPISNESLWQLTCQSTSYLPQNSITTYVNL